MSLKSVQAPLYGRFMHLAAIAGHLVGFYNFNRSNFRISFSQFEKSNPSDFIRINHTTSSKKLENEG